MVEVGLSPTSVLMGHGYVQHAGRQYRGEHCFGVTAI